MSRSNFYEIVRMDNNRVSIPKSSHFSIGTSPYYAHQHGLAIDIYQNLTLENYNVLSPISGKVLKIRTLTAPKPKFPYGLDVDYLLLISNFNDSELLWKIMHVKPYVKVGDKIDIGDILGKTIRNGYFAYWSSPHLHLELRDYKNPIRARGGKSFSLKFEKKKSSVEISEKVKTNHIPIKIHSTYPEIILVYLPEDYYHKISPFYGVKARLNNLDCILDGGIPHYKIGTIISQQISSNKLFPVYLGTHKIGTIYEINGHFGFFKFENMKFLLNNIEIRGISLYLANSLPLIKIIPFHKNEFSFKRKSIQYLNVVSS
jgi:hypothetical protein